MGFQFQFFDEAANDAALKPLEGFRYRPDLMSTADEAMVLTRVRQLPFREFDFHGYKGRRRVVSFGWQYDFSGHQLKKADDIPDFLLPARALAASFAGLEPAALQHVLVTEYGPGAGIGWHRDKAVFGQVVGISLLSPCTLRFRRKVIEDLPPIRDAKSSRARAQSKAQEANEKTAWDEKYGTGSGSDRVRANLPAQRSKVKSTWERVNVLAEPRSAYHLSGPARLEWQHGILRVESLRYSITFRNMRED
ncbi:MAG: alpha-ketoglutarate-dependent dioxygenase AlkB [Pyrinomonadaceae bacterium]